MEYYTIQEAAQKISDIENRKITKKDFIEIARTRSRIRLMAKVEDCCVSKYFTNLDDADVEIKSFSGIIRIPHICYRVRDDGLLKARYGVVQETHCKDDLGKLMFPYVQNAQSKEHYIVMPLYGQQAYKGRFVVLPCEVAGKLEYKYFVIPVNDLIVPKKDIHGYIDHIKL